MDKFVSVGYENSVNGNKVVAVVNADSRASKRTIEESIRNNTMIDATEGSKTMTIVILESGQVVLSAIKSETIKKRLNG